MTHNDPSFAVIGSGFLIGIIQFDRFGGDPLKRRIVDKVSGGGKYSLYQEILLKYQILLKQLFTSLYFIFLVFNPLIATIKSVSFVFEIDMPTCINYLQIFIGVFAWGFILQTLLEYCLLKYWVEFVWKSVRPIDDQFISIFLYLLNGMDGLLLTIWNIILESAIEYSQLSRPGFWIDKYSLHIKLATFCLL